jgi:hypothetical protein
MNEKSRKLRQQWLRDSREIIELPNVREDVGLFSQNAGNIFRYNIGLAMIAWRDACNPTTFLVEAIDDILTFRDDLISRGMTTSKLPLSTATIIASLIGRQSEFSIDCQVDTAGDLFLDCILGKRLQGSPHDAVVAQGIAHLSELKRQMLAASSYRTYFDLINRDKGSPDVQDLIASAESNFTARRKDAFYSGGLDIEGGGQYNNIAVDYRLSAVMKYRGLLSSSIHHWRW